MKYLLANLFFFFISLSLFAQGVGFTSVNGACRSENIQFTNTSPTNYTFVWQLDGITVSTSYHYSHSFNVAGNYEISLIGTGNGVTDTVSKTIQIDDQPTATFHTNIYNAAIGESFKNLNHSSGGSSYLWNFGGGAQNPSSSLAEPTNSYLTAGQKSIELIASSNSYCHDTLQKTMPFVYNKNSYKNNTWATHIDGHNTQIYEHDKGEVIKVAPDGGIITAGSFNSAKFNSEIGFSPIDFNSGFYIAKYSKEGALKWLVKGIDTVPGPGLINTSYRGSVKDLVVDADGNIYLTGWYGRHFKLYDNDGIASPLPSYTNNSTPGFLLKLDPDGVYQWHRSLSGAEGENIGIDSSKNIYVSGEYQTSIALSSDTGTTHLLNSNTSTWHRPFILKFDSVGNYIWATNVTYSGNNYYVELNDMDVSKDGDIYLVGQHGKALSFHSASSSSLNLDHPSIYGSTGPNVFVVKYNKEGNGEWVHSIGSSSINAFDYGNSVAIDGNYLYVGMTAKVYNSSHYVYIPSRNKATDTVSKGPFVLIKYNGNGDYIWSTGMNSSSAISNGTNTATFVDENGYVYCSGYVFLGGSSTGGIIEFNSRDSSMFGEVDSITTQRVSAFYVKYSPAGALVWATTESGQQALPGVDDIFPNDLSVDKNGFLYTTGIVNGTNMHMSTDQFTTDLHDAFLAKYSPSANFESDDIVIDGDDYRFCSGSSVTVAFTSKVPVSYGNTYEIEISTAFGQFNSYSYVLATKFSNKSRDSISFTVPSYLQQNRNYKIRVTASNPAIVGNQIPITILPSTPPAPNATIISFCENEEVLLTGRFDHTYEWSPTKNMVDSNAYMVKVAPDSAISYTVTNTSYCYQITDTIHLNKIVIDTILNVNNSILSTNEPQASHRWLDCQNNYTVIAGQDSSVFNPVTNGIFAAEITKNNCVDTTQCAFIINVGNEEFNLSDLIDVYPNPTSKNLTIESRLHSSENTLFRLYNSMGQLIEKGEVSYGKHHLTLSYSKGIYILEIIGQSEMERVKVIVD